MHMNGRSMYLHPIYALGQSTIYFVSTFYNHKFVIRDTVNHAHVCIFCNLDQGQVSSSDQTTLLLYPTLGSAITIFSYTR